VKHRGARRLASRVTRGALEVFLGLALLSGLGMVGTYFWGESRATRAVTDERNSHWQAVVAKLQAEAAARLAAETAKVKQQEDQWLANILTVGEALAKERAANARLRGDLSTAVARADRMRDQLATAATGGVPEAQDSTSACRARADALGRVLGEALRASEQCSLDAEDLAGGVRALRAGWPREQPDAVALPQP
jgi:hypothetical protein